MADNYFGITDTGKTRSNNEDTFIAETILGGRYIAACVIDGVGGYAGGEVAAAIAHDAILEHLESASGDMIVRLKESLSSANEAIYREKLVNKKNDQMACVLTLVVADLPNNKFYYAHVGDTRLYLLRDKSLVKVTRDHSFVGFLEDSGRLSEEAAMKHPKRNEINKALGFDSQIRSEDYIETGDSPFLPGDVLLLCSDGLSDMIDNSAMTSILITGNNLSAMARSLVSAANNAGGKDNITVVLVKNNKIPVKQQAIKPATTTSPVLHSNDAHENKVINNKDNTVEKAELKIKKRGAGPLITVLLLLVLAALVWLIYRDYINKKMREQQLENTVVVKERNEREQMLLDSINNTSLNQVFVLHTPGDPAIVVTDSIRINRDTLHIMGNGVTLKSDLLYGGPALSLAADCQFILLDNLVLENFDIGVLVHNNALHLNNVRFVNCRIPIQYDFRQPDRPQINGRYVDTLISTSDTFYNFYR